jgi:hypothetical protein
MFTYFTKSEARGYASSSLRKSHATDSARILSEAVHNSTDYAKYDVFLSHSSKDAELIHGIKSYLEGIGLTVYVDWLVDTQLDRNNVTSATANTLRKRMRQSNSLIWVATEASSSSKWMPWELGYFDGFRPNQVAVMPLVDFYGEQFRGQEYLGLYPLVRKNTTRNGDVDVFVEDEGKQWTTLRQFAKTADSWRYYSF